jgi:hypothetical protein
LNEAQKGIRVLGELILFISTDKAEGKSQICEFGTIRHVQFLKKAGL